MLNFKSVVLVGMLSISTAYAAEEYSKRILNVYCNDVDQVVDKLGGSGNIDTVWLDRDENVWFSFKGEGTKVAISVIPKNNRKEMCIVSYGIEIKGKKPHI
jgi:hypothetical protein